MDIEKIFPRKNKNLVLIVDDEDMVRGFFSQLCKKDGYQTIEAVNGKDGVEKAKAHLPDVILMDVNMPEMNGFTAIDILRDTESTKRIPIIIISNADSLSDRIEGISLGANDYITKPCNPLELSLRIRNNIKIKEYQDFLQGYNQILEKCVSERTIELNLALEDLQKANIKIKASTIETIYRLTLASEYKDSETGAHIKRIGHYSQLMARELGKDSQFTEWIFYAAPIHDIGKVGIPDQILVKPAALSPEEWKVMMTHTVIGARILHDSESDFLRMGELIARFHHERWDGSGYPEGFHGEDIPLEARIVNIADIYDAIRSRRPYKPPMDHEAALRIILTGDDRTRREHFDSLILQVFLDNNKMFQEIFDSMQ